MSIKRDVRVCISVLQWVVSVNFVSPFRLVGFVGHPKHVSLWLGLVENGFIGVMKGLRCVFGMGMLPITIHV